MKFQIIAGDPCLDFINTLDNRPVPERRKELLTSYRDLADWSVQAGVISDAQRRRWLRLADHRPAAARSVLQRAIRLRETLYALVMDLLRRRPAREEQLRAFTAFMERAFAGLELHSFPGGYRLKWRDNEPTLESILWPIASAASALLTSADSRLIRECDSPDCRWLFLDRSKNHSRRWCDMKVCGNRAKARTFYRIHSQPAPANEKAPGRAPRD